MEDFLEYKKDERSEGSIKKMSETKRGVKLIKTDRFSQYVGVRKNSNLTRWCCVFKYKGKQIRVGTFDTEEEAAIEYNKQAVQYFGEETKLNVIP